MNTISAISRGSSRPSAHDPITGETLTEVVARVLQEEPISCPADIDRIRTIQFSFGPGQAFDFWIDDVAFYK